MNPILINSNEALKEFLQQYNYPVPLVVEITPFEISDELKQTFPFQWHLKDSQRSFLTEKLNNPRYEFSYRQIFGKYLPAIKEMIARDSFRTTVISTWKNDEFIKANYKTRVACLLLMKFMKDSLTVVWRMRDIYRRFFPNIIALKEVTKEVYGRIMPIVDISLDVFERKDFFERIQDW